MGEVLARSRNFVIDGVVHASWRDDTYTNRELLRRGLKIPCLGRWVNKTRGDITRRRVTCIVCIDMENS